MAGTRAKSIEVDDIGFTVDLDNAAEVLALMLHHAPADYVEADVLLATLGDLTVTFRLLNADWHETGELPRYAVLDIGGD